MFVTKHIVIKDKRKPFTYFGFLNSIAIQQYPNDTHNSEKNIYTSVLRTKQFVSIILKPIQITILEFLFSFYLP